MSQGGHGKDCGEDFGHARDSDTMMATEEEQDEVVWRRIETKFSEE